MCDLKKGFVGGGNAKLVSFLKSQWADKALGRKSICGESDTVASLMPQDQNKREVNKQMLVACSWEMRGG